MVVHLLFPGRLVVSQVTLLFVSPTEQLRGRLSILFGPGGDGHCGPDNQDAGAGSCESYCLLLPKACPEQAGAPSDAGADALAQCELACNDLPGAALNAGYSIHNAAPGTLQCRLLHLARALEHPESRAGDCQSAIGLGDCTAVATSN
jgi:hypothetical protein